MQTRNEKREIQDLLLTARDKIVLVYDIISAQRSEIRSLLQEYGQSGESAGEALLRETVEYIERAESRLAVLDNLRIKERKNTATRRRSNG